MPPELPASLYGRLRDEVRADQLGVDQQETVLRRIRELWAEEGDADRALVLIEELGNRPDLLASVVPDVEALTMEIAADSAPTSRRRRGLDRWERLGRARQAGAGLGALSLAATAIAQLSSDLYHFCEQCPGTWGEVSGISRLPYVVLAGVVVIGLAALLSSRAVRVGGIVVLGAGVAMLAVVSLHIIELTQGRDVISRVGSGFWWRMVAGLLAVVAGAILVAAPPLTTADDRHEVSR